MGGKLIMTVKKFFILISSVATFYLLIGFTVNNSALSYDFYDWEHGEFGYENAIMEAEEDTKPLILYFHQDSCEWSKKLNDVYLAVYEIWDFLDDIPKVEINPDTGSAEEALCKKYGVERFPAFLVFIPSYGSKPEMVNPFSESQDMTVDEFMQAIKDKIVYYYNNKAHSSSENKDYEEALRYYEMAVHFDPKNVYAYYSMGIVYHSIAFKENDPKSLIEAEKKYLKALKIDPGHKESKNELKKVRDDLKRMQD